MQMFAARVGGAGPLPKNGFKADHTSLRPVVHRPIAPNGSRAGLGRIAGIADLRSAY